MRDDTATLTRPDWQRWLEVANSALAEVGVTPGWDLDASSVSTTGNSAAHYRSSLLADIAMGHDRLAMFGTPIGHCVCWTCWDAKRAHRCATVTYEAAQRFESCS